jgi:1-acyl-sn-glycerol-3-phosphate acyltransferase
MKLLKNIPFALWMYSTLWSLRQGKNEIRRCRREGDAEKEREAIFSVCSSWASNVLAHYGVEVETEGLENVPPGPVLFVSNHQGYADIIVFLSVINNKQIGFVAKDSLRWTPIFGGWIERIRSIFLLREDSREAVRVFQEGERLLREGYSLVIFPEGHRSKSDGMNPFKRGSIRLATKTGVPIIPVSIRGTWRLYEAQGEPKSGKVQFHIHPAAPTAGLSRQEIAGLAAQVEARIRSKIDEWNKTPRFE